VKLWCALLCVGSACAPPNTSLLLRLTGPASPGPLTVTLFDAAGQLKQEVFAMPLLPGTVRVQLPPVAKEYRVVVATASPGPLGAARVNASVREEVEVQISLEPSADVDPDGDRIPTSVDNCELANSAQADRDGDGLGDACAQSCVADAAIARCVGFEDGGAPFYVKTYGPIEFTVDAGLAARGHKAFFAGRRTSDGSSSAVALVVGSPLGEHTWSRGFVRMPAVDHPTDLNVLHLTRITSGNSVYLNLVGGASKPPSVELLNTIPRDFGQTAVQVTLDAGFGLDRWVCIEAGLEQVDAGTQLSLWIDGQPIEVPPLGRMDGIDAINWGIYFEPRTIGFVGFDELAWGTARITCER
jgi:hypothetical protein